MLNIKRIYMKQLTSITSDRSKKVVSVKQKDTIIKYLASMILTTVLKNKLDVTKFLIDQKAKNNISYKTYGV